MKIRANITAYYPSNEGVEGGYLDALGNLLDPNHLTCAAPPEIPFHTMIKISDTNTKYDDMTFEVLDRGSAIIIDDKGIYHIDLLMHTKEECNEFGRRMGYIEILEEGDGMSKYKVSIDAGHGLNTPGKRTPKLLKDLIVNGKTLKKKGNIIHEFEFNILVAKSLKKALERHGIDVKIVNDVTGKTDTPLSTRASRANAFDSDLHISCHYNAIGSCASFQSRCSGLLVLKTKGCQSKSNKLADCVHNAIKGNYSHTYGVGVDTQWSGFTLAILRQTKMPAILIEYGFMDFEKEAMKMLNPSWYNKLAEDTCKGVCDYLGITYKKSNNSKGTQSPSGSSEFKPYIVRVNTDGLNARKGAGVEYDIECVLNKGVAITIIKEKKAKDGGTWCKALSGYWCNKKYLDFVRYK